MKGILRIGIGAFVAGAAFVAGIAVGQWTPGQQGITFRSYKSGQNSQIENPTTDVINSQGELQKLWPMLTGEQASQAPKDVKWNDERLILVALGQRNTGGYKVFVKAIERKNSNLVVQYVEKMPPAGQPVLTVITSPWELVRAPRVSGNISFEKRVDKGFGYTVIDLGSSCGCSCKCCVNNHRPVKIDG